MFEYCKRCFSATVALALFAIPLHAQPGVPVIDLTIETTSPARFSNIFNVRQIANGHVIVNDGIRRQLIALDATLANPRVLIDSVATGGNSYGNIATPLIPYLADSSFFADGITASLVVIDPLGKVARTSAVPAPIMFRFIAGGQSAIDRNGNLLFQVVGFPAPSQVGSNGAPQVVTQQLADSGVLVRANFETQKLDTIARLKQQSQSKLILTMMPNRTPAYRFVLNPVESYDTWAVLSDGTVAILRGHDYRIDFLNSTGTIRAAEKLPFDWKQLSDDAKQQIVDSAKADADRVIKPLREKADSAGFSRAMSAIVTRSNAGFGVMLAPSAQVRRVGQSDPMPDIDYAPAKELGDYLPPFNNGAMKADNDGHLWILPRTSSASRAGELVYDVVDGKGVLVQRVRVPVGRSIIGFGPGGTVYLMQRDATGWVLERAQVRIGNG